MKKILLILTAVLLTVGATAQNTERKIIGQVKVADTEGRKTVKAFNAMKAAAFKKQARNKTLVSAPPAGEEKQFYADFTDYPVQLGLAPRWHMPVKIVFTADNKAYIQNIMATDDVKNVWIECSTDAARTKITIPGECPFTTLEDGTPLSIVHATINSQNQLQPETGDFTFKIDPESGIIESEPNHVLVVITPQGNVYTLATDIQFIPENLFPETTTNDYSYTYEALDGSLAPCNGKVNVIDIGEALYINGLMPDYPDAWIVGLVDNTGLNLYSGSVLDDYSIIANLDYTQGKTLDKQTLAYDAASDSYKAAPRIALIDFYVGQDGGSSYQYGSSDLIIKKTGTTGINNITGDNEGKEVSKTELFDLSGRRVNNTQNGVAIKVVKFADGTSKAVKVIK